MTKKVKVYSTSACPWCKRAKDFLKEKGVEFEDIDVGSDQEAARDMIERSGQMGVPVVEIDGVMIVGFNQPRIEEELNK